MPPALVNDAIPSIPARRYFFDWLRIIAFFILIAYHVGMYYVSWDWHVKSPAAGSAIEPLMQLSSPWRLGLLFLISGAASAFMLQKTGAGSFARLRSWRLLPPLLFGMLVVVPPQAYFEVVEKVAYAGSYADFMRLYLTGYHGFCKNNSCLDLPTWNHLWFVVYLWVYTLLLALIAGAFGRRLDALSRGLARLLGGWKTIVLPVTLLGLIRIALLERYPSTHALLGDWFNHANYFTLFLLGALLATRREFWTRLDALRWSGLGSALVCWAMLMIYYALPDSMLSDPAKAIFWRDAQRLVYALCEWSAIVAACGFAHRHLEFDGPARRYLTQAVFPVYIVHQTLIVVLAHSIKPAAVAPGVEAVVLIVLTIGFSFGIFEIVRRVPVLRPVFGLGKLDSAQPRLQAAGPAGMRTQSAQKQ